VGASHATLTAQHVRADLKTGKSEPFLDVGDGRVRHAPDLDVGDGCGVCLCFSACVPTALC
jgi:hypothetical protein